MDIATTNDSPEIAQLKKGLDAAIIECERLTARESEAGSLTMAMYFQGKVNAYLHVRDLLP